MSKVLVTGGAGFIGSHLCSLLMRHGHDVVCLDNFFTGRKQNIAHLVGNPQFELVEHDVTRPFDFAVDQIYNLACPASPVHYQKTPVETIRTCVLGAINCLELAKRREESLDSEQGAALRESLASPERGPEREAADGEIRSRLEAAIAGLPEEQHLQEYGGLTFAEIAGLLGCPLSTALSRMRYAALKLRGSLEGLDA